MHDAHEPRYRLLVDGEVLVIGGNYGCNVVLADSTVLDRHVRVTVGDKSALFSDLGGGMVVNDERVDRAFVGFEDSVVVGETLLELESADFLPERQVERRHVVQPGVEEGFLATLREDPSDDATREIYADWLDSVGERTCAAFVRLQLGGTATLETSEVIRAAIGLTDPAWRAIVSRGRIRHCEAPCPGRWHMLSPTERDDEHYCTTCREDVRYCTTLDDVSACGRRDTPCVYDAQLIERRADEAYEVPTAIIR